MKFFILFDANKFYASCERADKREVCGKPVIVLSNNDGSCICASAESKALGFKMGSKLFEEPFRSIARRNRIAIYSTNFPKVGDFSLRFKDILRKYVTILEDYSVDEEFAFLVEAAPDMMEELARAAIDDILLSLFIPMSCGIGTTKTLAKLAMEFAKSYKGYKGVCMIGTDEQRIKALRLTAIGDVWNIGPKKRDKLKAMGITTAYDFAEGGIVTQLWIKKHLTIVGVRTWTELKGISCIEIEEKPKKKKSIMVSRSFGKNVEDLDTLISAMVTYAYMNGKKLRKQESKARILKVTIETNVFRENDEQDRPTMLIELPVATNSDIELGERVAGAVRMMYRPGLKYKKGYVETGGFEDSDAIQSSMNDDRDRDKEDRLTKARDYITGRWGPGILRTGAQGVGKFDWWIKQEYLTPVWNVRPREFHKAEDYPLPVSADTAPEPIWAESNGYGYFTTTTKPPEGVAARGMS